MVFQLLTLLSIIIYVETPEVSSTEGSSLYGSSSSPSSIGSSSSVVPVSVSTGGSAIGSSSGVVPVSISTGGSAYATTTTTTTGWTGSYVSTYSTEVITSTNEHSFEYTSTITHWSSSYISSEIVETSTITSAIPQSSTVAAVSSVSSYNSGIDVTTTTTTGWTGSYASTYFTDVLTVTGTNGIVTTSSTIYVETPEVSSTEGSSLYGSSSSASSSSIGSSSNVVPVSVSTGGSAYATTTTTTTGWTGSYVSTYSTEVITSTNEHSFEYTSTITHWSSSYISSEIVKTSTITSAIPQGSTVAAASIIFQSSGVTNTENIATTSGTLYVETPVISSSEGIKLSSFSTLSSSITVLAPTSLPGISSNIYHFSTSEEGVNSVFVSNNVMQYSYPDVIATASESSYSSDTLGSKVLNAETFTAPVQPSSVYSLSTNFISCSEGSFGQLSKTSTPNVATASIAKSFNEWTETYSFIHSTSMNTIYGQDVSVSEVPNIGTEMQTRPSNTDTSIKTFATNTATTVNQQINIDESESASSLTTTLSISTLRTNTFGNNSITTTVVPQVSTNGGNNELDATSISTGSVSSGTNTIIATYFANGTSSSFRKFPITALLATFLVSVLALF
ncbi:uncharacterized protein SCODWIG_03771 [Saccharomycodes ludwigii]|uniref:Uncharacterized protein n=1 Tax=Saccharomycodes ludwigii TaxID=36035 RepID=A0A376BBP6_9ASCO|nr:uncharacterized protein SCODWIG_03771 [Saccharomycodes ludwigii]